MTTITKESDTAIVKPTGGITATTVDEFRAELKELVDSGETNLTIDLSDVDIIDSKGLSVFILCHQTLSAAGGELTVVTDNDDIRGLFHIMRLDTRFTVRGTQD